ncbi:UDP-N-acetylmuramoyl-L-alanyl-D-glutamate--2,6-diaminopimelate ligase [Fuchsiella alkaliacetigena]|uniref:UDP-N-acetylmuramoyl-L-alanyl-D-glutamate--2, 6-diaminopimelate ligase n=1 Tax=Fuchsiella alkaliacetigena TaxID=957042 RepID=UPI00200A07C3|nr:UDP-N-acetylmuramoyl-L-alanyl-D-glutamate--2,6-diaminopimelate ligase [Fuchsiella alkaliacetigena]MCK8823678.1 UDP-N-acetylmuramoyl-L-alanyl-D-glutamate--2,6-diaminopimelate ligase [Fuchsiella alkaliacetigena]
MKELSSLIADLDYQRLQGDLTVEITGIAYDSRKVEAGEIFVCIDGFTQDGHNYIEEAIENGAQALLVEREIEAPNWIPIIKTADNRLALAVVSAEFYDHPSRKLKVVGVTGTNGKTTTTYLVNSILREAGYKSGLVGTIENQIGDRNLETERTTPEALDLQSLLAEMVEEGVTHVVMEVSSHALSLKRVNQIDFDIAIFTNITQDHLDFHDSLEEYLAAKRILFAELDDDEEKTAIINIDDPYAEDILKSSRPATLTYSIEKDANLKAREITISPTGVDFLAETANGELELDLNLTGLFNVYNTLAALGVGIALGIDSDDIKAGLEKVEGVAGRFEIINEGQDFGVIVDYAHTPDSLENILETAQDFVEGRIILVFGCGGDRDRTKRPLMGQIAMELADFSIITSDNPRSEDPQAIIDDIEVGIKEQGKIAKQDYLIIEERRQAIRQGIELAEAQDLVFIVGKGHETYQILKDKTIPFDDRQVAREALAELRG